MRERVRDDFPERPASVQEMIGTAEHVVRLLRTGGEELALLSLASLNGQLTGLMAELTRKQGHPGPLGEVLPALQEAALCQSRQDPIGLADVVQYRILPPLRRCPGA